MDLIVYIFLAKYQTQYHQVFHPIYCLYGILVCHNDIVENLFTLRTFGVWVKQFEKA